MNKLWHDEAWEDYVYWQTQDKKYLKKINRLLKDIDRNGYNCIGKPEALSGNLAGFWSVRIDEKTVLSSGSKTALWRLLSAARITETSKKL